MRNIHEAQEQSAIEHERNAEKSAIFVLIAAIVVVSIALLVTLFVISLFI
jgi:hypothetical protein